MSMTRNRPLGLWANKKLLPAIRERLKSKIPKLGLTDVRRFRLPYYEAVLTELFEDGYNYTAVCLKKLVHLEEELYENNLVTIRLFQRKDLLLAIADTAKKAEREAFLNDNKELAFQMLLEMVLAVEEEGKLFCWLTAQVYRLIFYIIEECDFASDEVRCRTRYFYARFLDDKLRLYNEAMKEFQTARNESENTHWITNQITFHLLFRDINRGYISAVLHKAHQVKSVDMEEAEKLMEFALPMMYRYSDKVDICEQLIKWSDILVELQHLAKAEKVLVKALKYGYSCQSVQHRCLILLKQGLTYHRLKNFDRSTKKFKRALEIADEYEFHELRALTRMHFGFIHFKEGLRLKYGVRLLTEAIEIFKESENMELLRLAEYYLAISKANQIFDDVCATIRGAAKLRGPQSPFWNKWKDWQYRKKVLWNCKPSIEEVEDEEVKVDVGNSDTDREEHAEESGSQKLPEVHGGRSMAEFFLNKSKLEFESSVGLSRSTIFDEDQDIHERIDLVVNKLKNIGAGELGFTINPAAEIIEETT